jgi:YbbR domain-containing protein
LIFAIFLSFALWIYVSYEENPDRSTSFEGMPVQVQDVPSGLVIVDQEGLPRPDQTTLSSVNLVVKADQETLTKLSQRHLNPLIDLSGLSPGDHQVPVNVELNRTDLRMNNFSSIDPDPEFIQVRLEQVITKTVPLTIEVQGNLPSSFERGEPEVTFSGKNVRIIEVRGPQNRVSRVASAQAIANIEQLSTNYVAFRDLEAVDANEDSVEGVELDPSTVRVFVPIRSVVGLKRVPVLGAIEGSPASGYVVADVTSDPPLITITGSSRRLDEIDQIETRPVDISGATEVVTGQVKLDLPLGVSSHRSDDSSVLVTVEIMPLLRPFQVELPFTVKLVGNTRQLVEQYDPEVIMLSVSGFSPSLTEIDKSRLVATVDVEGLSPGSYSLTPDIDLPDGLQLQDDIAQVNVTLGLPPTPTPTPTLMPTLSPSLAAPTTETISTTTPLRTTIEVLTHTVEPQSQDEDATPDLTLTSTMLPTASPEQSDISPEVTVPVLEPSGEPLLSTSPNPLPEKPLAPATPETVQPAESVIPESVIPEADISSTPSVMPSESPSDSLSATPVPTTPDVPGPPTFFFEETPTAEGEDLSLPDESREVQPFEMSQTLNS